MPLSAPVLATKTLVMPQKYSRTRTYRGGRQIMLNGSTVVDLVSTAAKHEWEMSWPALTDAQLTTLQEAFDALKDTSGNFTDIDGTVYDGTTRSKVSLDGTPQIAYEAVSGGGSVRWSVSIKLRQE